MILANVTPLGLLQNEHEIRILDVDWLSVELRMSPVSYPGDPSRRICFGGN